MSLSLRQHLIEECHAMVKFLSASGKQIPTESVPLLEGGKENCTGSNISDPEILILHRALSKKVAPARPETIWLLCKESKKSNFLKFLGPVALVRRMMLTALVSLIFFVSISLSPEINFQNIKLGIYEQNDMTLLIVMFFLLSAASLGATFSNLFMANQYIVKNIFNPNYESSYWTRYVLGIIAGIMLAVMIPLPDVQTGDTDSIHLAVASRPVLAMLGGFSASLVYRVLFRLVYAVEAIFVGKQSEETDQKIARLQTSNDIELENEKQLFVGKLLHLQSQINQGKSAQEIDREMEKMIAEM